MEKQASILDQAIKKLKAGQAVDLVLRQFREAPGLKPLLEVAQKVLSLPKKSLAVSRQTVWQKITTRISARNPVLADPRLHPLSFFRFVFSKSMFTVITLLIIAGLLNSTAVAAKNSLPGQTLYPVKRTVEKLELTLTIDQVKKTEVQIKHAETRLTEAKIIVETKTIEGQVTEPKTVEAVKQTISESVDTSTEVVRGSAGNKELLKKVVELTDKQESVLSEIEPKVEGEIKQAVVEALGTTAETKAQAEQTLAQLEQKESGSTGTTATSTPQDKTQESTKDQNPAPAPTSTESTLEALGNPTATTTDPEPPPSTTPEIIELK